MKKSIITTILLLLILLLSLDGIAKSKYRSYSKRNTDWKGYIGGAIGPVIPLGNFPQDAKIGYDFSGNFGYTFGNNFGVTINYFDTFVDIKNEKESSTLIKLGVLAGPLYQIKINQNLNLDLKISGGYMFTDSLRIQAINARDVVGKGLAFDLGSSLRLNFWRNRYIGINVDYLFCRPKYDGETRDLTSINIGFALGWLLK